MEWMGRSYILRPCELQKNMVCECLWGRRQGQWLQIVKKSISPIPWERLMSVSYICVWSFLCDLWQWLISTRNSSQSCTNVFILQMTEIWLSLVRQSKNPEMRERQPLKDSSQDNRQPALLGVQLDLTRYGWSPVSWSLGVFSHSDSAS